MVMSGSAQWVFTVMHFLIAIGVTVWLLRRYDRSNALIAVLVLVGGGLSIFAEPFLDRMGFIWHAQHGQWTFVEMFGHSVPLWMLPVYYWFIGGQTLYVLNRLRNGATARDLWKLYVFFCVADAVLEMPILYAGGVYTYFGHQPFWNADVFPLPGWYIVANGLLPMAGAAIVLLLSSLGDRRYLWTIPVAIPLSIFAVYAAFAWPVWAALGADVSRPVTYLAGTATIVLALYVRQLLAIASVRAAAGGAAGPKSLDRTSGHTVQLPPMRRARVAPSDGVKL
jgi:lipoprotein signal peptidase